MFSLYPCTIKTQVIIFRYKNISYHSLLLTIQQQQQHQLKQQQINHLFQIIKSIHLFQRCHITNKRKTLQQ